MAMSKPDAQSAGENGAWSSQDRDLWNQILDRHQLAQQSQEEQKFTEAISLRQTNLELLLGNASFKDSELTEQTRQSLYSSCQQYGDKLYEADAYRTAADAYKQAFQAISTSRSADHPDVVEARDGYANDLKMLGNTYFREAAYAFEQNSNIRTRLYGRNDHRTTVTEDSRAEMLSELSEEDQARAVEIYRENLELYQVQTLMLPNDEFIQDLIDSTKFSLALVLEKLGARNLNNGNATAEQKRYLVESQRLCEEALKYRKQKSGGVESEETVFVRSHLACVLFYQRRFREARKQFRINRKHGQLLSAEENKAMKHWIEGCERAEKLPPGSDSESDAETSATTTLPERTKTSSTMPKPKQSSSAETAQASTEEQEHFDPRPIRRQSTLASLGYNDSPVRTSGESQTQQVDDDDDDDDQKSPRLGILYSKDATESHEWEAGLRKTHGLLEMFKDETKNEYRHVKIAILDSGIDGSLQFFKHSTRIKAWKSWVEGDNKTGVLFDENPTRRGDLIASSCRDEIGHGTHATALMMEINPLADIYVARVTKKKKTILPEDVAAAIVYAIKEWKVDIISMSLGFEYRPESIVNAVVQARSSGVLMFAAGSNDSGNSPVKLFPAYLDDVVCVSAASRKGKPADGQAVPQQFKNYATLGVEVSSKWPRSLCPANTKEDDLVHISSGSSIATAVMSASASLFFEFLRQEAARNKDVVGHMRTAERGMKEAQGMRSILDAITEVKDDYRYVVPWNLLNKKMLPAGAYSPRMYASLLILQNLSKYGLDFKAG